MQICGFNTTNKPFELYHFLFEFACFSWAFLFAFRTTATRLYGSMFGIFSIWTDGFVFAAVSFVCIVIFFLLHLLHSVHFCLDSFSRLLLFFCSLSERCITVSIISKMSAVAQHYFLLITAECVVDILHLLFSFFVKNAFSIFIVLIAASSKWVCEYVCARIWINKMMVRTTDTNEKSKWAEKWDWMKHIIFVWLHCVSISVLI